MLESSSNNIISENNIANNERGIEPRYSSGNTIYHNNFLGNAWQVHSKDSTNVWDSGYPSGGNYWSDYAGSDGIGDMPYIIDASNRDKYPLVKPLTIPKIARWIVIAYLAFDNDLSPWKIPRIPGGWDDIFGKFKRVGSTKDVNLIVFRDYRSEEDSGIYYVMKDRYPFDWNVIAIKDGFEANTGNPEEFNSFLANNKRNLSRTALSSDYC